MVLLNPPLSASSAMDIFLIYSILINVDNICCNNHANIVFFTARVKQWSQSYGTCLWRHWWWWRYIGITWRADLLPHHQERYHLQIEVRNGSKVMNGLYLHLCTFMYNGSQWRRYQTSNSCYRDFVRYLKNIPLPLLFVCSSFCISTYDISVSLVKYISNVILDLNLFVIENIPKYNQWYTITVFRKYIYVINTFQLSFTNYKVTNI